MHRFIFLSTVFVFLLPIQICAMVGNDIIIVDGVLSLNNNSKDVPKMDHGKLQKPFINFERVKKAVDKELEEDKNNKIDFLPLKFLNPAALTIDEKEKTIEIKVLKEKEQAFQQVIVEEPKVENKKKKGKTVAFLINEADGSMVPLGANQLNAERIVHLQETVINPVANKPIIIIPPFDIPFVPVDKVQEKENSSEQIVAQEEQVNVKAQKDTQVVSLQEPTRQLVIVKQPPLKKPVIEKPHEMILWQRADDELKAISKNETLDDNSGAPYKCMSNLKKELKAIKALLQEAVASKADQKTIMQLMFKSYNGTLAATYTSIKACMDTNDITIASSWLGKLLKCASAICEAISETKDHQFWFEMVKEIGIFKRLATDNNEQGMQGRYNRVLASSVGLVGFYGICNYTFQKWHSNDEKMQKSIFSMYEPIKQELEFCIQYLIQEYHALPFKLSTTCPEEHLKIMKFLEKRAGLDGAETAKKFCKNSLQDPAALLLLGTQKLEKAIIQDKAAHYFKGLVYWREMVDKNPHTCVTKDITRILKEIMAEESSFFSPFRRRAFDILLSIKNPLLPEDEQYKKNQLMQKESIKKEIKEFDPINKQDEIIKDKALKAYQWGFDEQALILLEKVKSHDFNTLLCCADLYATISPIKAYLLLSQEKLIKLGEQNPYDDHFAWHQAILDNLIKENIPQAATMKFLTSQFFKDKFGKISFEQNRNDELFLMLQINDWSFPISMLSSCDVYSELFSKDKDPKFIRTFDLLLVAFASRLIDHLNKRNPTVLHSNNWYEIVKQKEWCKDQLTKFIDKVGRYVEGSLCRTGSMEKVMRLIHDEFNKLSDVVKKDPQVAQAAAIAASYISLIPTKELKDPDAEKKIWGALGDVNNLPVEQLDFYSQWLKLYYGDNVPLKSLEKVYCAAFKKGDLDAFVSYVNIIPDLIKGDAKKLDFKNNAVFEKAEEQEYINNLIKNNPGQEVKIYSLWMQKKILEGRMGIATEIVHDMSKNLCKKAIDAAQIILDEKNFEAKLLQMNLSVRNFYKSNELKTEIKKGDKLLDTYLNWLMDSALKPLHITWVQDYLFVGAYFEGLKVVLNDIVGVNSNSDLNKLVTKMNQIDTFEQILRLLIDPVITLSAAKMGCNNMRIDNRNTVSVNLLKMTAEMFCNLAEKALDDQNGFLVRKDWAYLFITNASDIVRNKLKGKDQKDLLDRLKLVSDKLNEMDLLFSVLPEKLINIANKIKCKESAQTISAHKAGLAVINQVTKQAELANEQLKQAENSYEEMDALADTLFEQDEYKGLKEELDL